MDFAEWEPLYRQILADFGFDQEADEAAARLLAHLLPAARATPDDLQGLLADRPATVLGNGPSLAGEIQRVEGVVLAADEATSVALEHGLVPAVVVTDLDGRVADQREAQVRGALVVVHAHGDNVPALERWVSRFGPRILGTTQSVPFPGIHNFGGFTDGDRAAFLADHFGAASIRLLGFDFQRPSPKDVPREIKRRKLAWARRLLEDLARRRPLTLPSSSS